MQTFLLTLVLFCLAASPLEAALSKGGRYQLTLRPRELPLLTQTWISWDLHLESTDQKALKLQGLLVEGGMPSHGHGLSSEPKIRRGAGPNDFIVEGLRFEMSGSWELRVRIADDKGFDEATFPIEVIPFASRSSQSAGFTPSEMALLQSMSIENLKKGPVDPSNRVLAQPRAVELGRRLFFDKRLSGNGSLSCSSCHEPERWFTDGRVKAQGLQSLSRNTPTIIGSAYQTWFHWDGLRDSLWSQALVPLETDAEMGGDRLAILRLIATDSIYKNLYQELFGKLPDLDGWPEKASPFRGDAWSTLSAEAQAAINLSFANIGKAIAAFEAQVKPGVSAFDRYLAAIAKGDSEASEAILSPLARAGLKMFISPELQCTRCHNGPLLSNNEFKNIGTGSEEQLDFGRGLGQSAVLMSEFNCRGSFNDEAKPACPHLEFLSTHDTGRLNGAFKVPSLRSVSQTGPYMHDGRFTTLRQVLDHYRRPEKADAFLEFRPLMDLTPQHLDALEAFLRALDATPEGLGSLPE